MFGLYVNSEYIRAARTFHNRVGALPRAFNGVKTMDRTKILTVNLPPGDPKVAAVIAKKIAAVEEAGFRHYDSISIGYCEIALFFRKVDL